MRIFPKKERREYGWFGNYETWNEALQDSSGYDTDEIFMKVSKAALKVKNGEVVYERDSVVFDEIQYSWPLLASLMYVSAKNDGSLNILDFGGSLGTTYFQNRILLNGLFAVQWNIVEQKHFVDFGNTFIKNENLKFYYSIDECLKIKSPNIILLSSVLQYLESPYSFIENLIKKHTFDFILIDRTGFIKNHNDLLTIQKVPPTIYNASYPCWFFAEDKFFSIFKESYEILIEYMALDNYKGLADCKGYLFQKV